MKSASTYTSKPLSGFDLILPCCRNLQSEPIAIICLGQSKEKIVYCQDDFNVLRILTYQTGILIERKLMLEDITKIQKEQLYWEKVNQMAAM